MTLTQCCVAYEEQCHWDNYDARHTEVHMLMQCSSQYGTVHSVQANVATDSDASSTT